jgi:alpha-1,3-glucosyltransferase
MVLGGTVLSTLFLALIPFGLDLQVWKQIFWRVFPVSRGLYEDKVANFWCAISIVVKLRNIFALQQLIRLSVVTTLIAVLPACLVLFRNPIGVTFVRVLAISSLGFFLFSFQVHEKSILLPLLPISMLFPFEETFVVWFHNVAMFSLWPLLKKDGLLMPYISSILLWNALFTYPSKWKGIPKGFVMVTFFYVAKLRAHDYCASS